MHLRSDSFDNGQPIPAEFAFGQRGDPVALSDNRSPHLAWQNAPSATRSFVLTCIDPDVPSRGDDVNQPGRTVPADLPRVEFVHWLMANIPAECGELAAGACSDGITARGKRAPFGPPGSVQGVNDYTGWFAGDAEMGGEYRGYDGPCPPWNDARLHHYHFKLHALDVAALPLAGGFSLAELRAAMAGHVLAEAELVGSYSLNPAVAG
ncbi:MULTISPECIES: YbhB/YbcL family Raf kinase inhibitor-like protein [Rhodanobacter]|uniref:Phospholipid-binding protein, PBP family n=1 Tax=Rhodanobacter denitrificans TaxID=666685 RepID=M4NBT4_9GAMM|nr:MULTISPECIES: YbhB/YbcL family Raf kinase inhibitor-like protein [Rhodanobacter]AGG87237.1 phospholipid-binding protein, PBP family [Rhodanobacter denitrificans]UJJ51158.1 YbhB/YbcL family Raf kinase inhibitor-like protein [Rhodanobacter denitrificans]UJJ60058.1 YbhB/YbcL family Raf kinase inhibitor-like protein [Rhodanobacter denitrificans]UJM86424.1 YbhB/YbcL family Raf kinase inhibitor-like protein [Rhodanobacter denitrificans]